VEGISYLSTAFSLAPGEGLLLYSDGVTEAKDAIEAFFGRERLLENWRGSPRRIRRHMRWWKDCLPPWIALWGRRRRQMTSSPWS
jgi:hypothetical protein